MGRRRVMIVRLDNAGDVLLSGPAVRAVAASADVVYCCGPSGEEAARLLPGVDEVLVRRAEWIDPDPEPPRPAALAAFVEQLAGVEVDEAIVLTSFHQSPLPMALLLKWAGVPRVAAISTDYPGSLLDVRHLVDDDVHEVQRSLSLVGRLGYRLPLGDDGALRVRDASAPPPWLPEAFVVVHPGASDRARAPSPERAEAIAAAVSGAGWPVVVTGGPGESALAGRVAHAAAGISLAGAVDLAGLAGVLGAARAVVVGNTGPGHLAAAVGTPVVSLYAPTVPAVRWRPWQVPHVLLGDQAVPCAGCRARVCPVPGHPCIDDVAVDEVVDALTALCGRAPGPAMAVHGRGRARSGERVAVP